MDWTWTLISYMTTKACLHPGPKTNFLPHLPMANMIKFTGQIFFLLKLFLQKQPVIITVPWLICPATGVFITCILGGINYSHSTLQYN